MRMIEIFQVGNLYVRLDLPSFKQKADDRLLGLLSFGGIYKVCTDPTFKDCKLFKFDEFRVGLIFAILSFGVKKELDKQGEELWDQT